MHAQKFAFIDSNTVAKSKQFLCHFFQFSSKRTFRGQAHILSLVPPINYTAATMHDTIDPIWNQ